jgi:hypothetical protein
VTEVPYQIFHEHGRYEARPQSAVAIPAPVPEDEEIAEALSEPVENGAAS